MGRSKPQVVRRVASLQEYEQWIEHCAQRAKTRLDRAVDEAADDDDDGWAAAALGQRQQAGKGGKKRAARLWADESGEENEEEEEQDVMDDGLSALDDEDAAGEAELLAEAEEEAEAAEAAAAAARAKKRRRREREGGQGGSRRKKQRKRRRVRRAVEEDESDEDAAEDEALRVELESLQAQIKLGIPAPEAEPEGEERRALRIQRTSFRVDALAWPADGRRRFASVLHRAHAFAPPRLRLSPPENLMDVVWEGDAGAALGVRGEEGVRLLMALCEATSPPLAYYEAVGEGAEPLLHVDVYLTQRAVGLARADNDPPTLSPHLRRIRRLLELCTSHALPPASTYYGQHGGRATHRGGGGESDGGAAAAAVARGPFDPADLYRCLEEYKAAHLRRLRRGSGGGGGGGGGVEESKGGSGGQEEEEKELQVPGLAVTLRPYQRDAVQWMMSREKGEPFFLPPVPSHDDDDDPALPHGWRRLRVGAGGEAVYYNPFSVAVSREPPRPWSVDGIRGGILADEVRGVMVGNAVVLKC